MKKQIFYLFIWLVFPIQAQWTLQDSGTTENLNDVYCISADTVVVVGDNGTILRTTNGGSDWLPVSNPATGNLHQVQFIDTQTGYAAGDSGVILKTTDAGVSWQNLNTNTTENLLALSVLSSDILFVGGNNGLIMKTMDGGITWNILNTGLLLEDVFDLQIMNNDVVYGIGADLSGSYYIKSINQGTDWESISISPYNSPTSLYFFDLQHGYIIGLPIFSVTNNAVDFADFPIPEPGGSYDIFAFSETDFWIVGMDYRQNNYGEGFIAKYNNDPNAGFYEVNYGGTKYNAIKFTSSIIGYVVGDNGAILKNETGLPEFATGINTRKKNIRYNVSPNPAKNIVKIKCDFNLTNLRYKIYNLQGLLIKDDSLESDQIDVSNLDTGIYLLEVFYKNMKYTNKLIIQK